MVTSSLTLVRGDDQDIGVSITQVDGTTPYDLAGSSLSFLIRRSTYFSPVLLTVAASIIDATEGLAKITLVPADTVNFNDGTYFFEIKLLDAASKTTTLTAGALTIQPR